MQERSNTEANVLVNPFQQEGNWYKANLHTHSKTSDGTETVEERVRQYRNNGYSILALTDHDKTNDVTGVTTKEFLGISGMETHPASPLPGDVYHLVCLNVPYGFALPGELDANSRIQRVKDAGGEAIYAHPYWCGHNFNHMVLVNGYIGIEVYNATCSKIGKAYSSVQWDDLLSNGYHLPAVAVDDCHGGRDLFMGWTMIKARDLTVKSIMDALRTGSYYASCGPQINDFGIRDGKAFVECSPAAEIHLISQAYFGGSRYADNGPDVTSAEIGIDPNMRYVRAEVVDRQGRRAWTNPILLKM